MKPFSPDYYPLWISFFATITLALYLFGGTEALLANGWVIMLGIALVLGLVVVEMTCPP